MTANDARKAIQEILHVSADGIIGEKTKDAYELLESLPAGASWPLPPVTQPSGNIHRGHASSFADTADVSAFRRCKAQGNSDQFCFAKGDNGIGFTGLDCTDESKRYIALPPEQWHPRFGSASNAVGKPVVVTCNGQTLECILADTMPHEAHITNGAILDMAPGAQKAFGLTAPFMVPVEWAWPV